MSLYDVVGVHPTASLQEIKTAYRQTSKLHHPDKHVNSTAQEKKIAEKNYQRLRDAYAILSNAGDREKYDIHLQEQQREQQRREQRERQEEERQQRQRQRQQRRRQIEEQPPSYVSCPLNDIICMPCKYRIKYDKDHSLCTRMGNHESRSHNIHLEKTQRQRIVEEHELDMKEKVMEIADLLLSDQHEEAFVTYKGYLGGTIQEFCYCEDCDALVEDATYHKKNRRHRIDLTVKINGMASIHCEGNNPLIIPIESFSFDNKKCFSEYFYKELHKELDKRLSIRADSHDNNSTHTLEAPAFMSVGLNIPNIIQFEREAAKCDNNHTRSNGDANITVRRKKYIFNADDCDSESYGNQKHDANSKLKCNSNHHHHDDDDKENCE
jgi:curved DNA-binding protein CbpA